jgi:phage terminase small subunit
MGESPLPVSKQEHFCQLVNNGDNPTRAYIVAGYSETGASQGASRLLRNVNVSARLDYLRNVKEKLHQEAVKEVVKKAALSKEWVLEQLIENVQMAKAAEAVLNKDGEPTGEYRQNLAAANKALELLGSELGMFIKKVETGKPGEFQDLNDDELNRQIADVDRALSESERAINFARTKAAEAFATSGKTAPPSEA